MKVKVIVIAGGLAVLVAVGLLLMLKGGRPQESIDEGDSSGASSSPAHPSAELSAPPPSAQQIERQGREARRAAIAAGREEHETAIAADAAPGQPGANAAQARRLEDLAYKAKVKQLDAYRTELESSRERAARLTEILKRLQRDPSVSSQQRTQVQTQLQQLIDAEPRMTQHLEDLRAELRRDKSAREGRDRKAAGLPPLRNKK